MQGSEVEASFVSSVSLRHRLPAEPWLLRCSATLLSPAQYIHVDPSYESEVSADVLGNISACRGNNDGNTPSNEETIPARVSSADW
jgi:hypothetical protein